MTASDLLLGLYRACSPAIGALLPIATKFSAKLTAGVEGRRGLSDRLREAGPGLQGCIWVHVTSVGEYEQARPLIAAIKARPDAPPVAVTHFSPSGFEYARKRPVADFHDYLPLDRAGEMRDLLRWWRPRLLLFVKFDCWPVQVAEAHAAQVPLLLLAGSLAPTSGRLRDPARVLYRGLFDRFEHLGVCTPEDRDRFIDRMGVRCPVSVTGDTRAEQVILRYEASADGETARLLQAAGGRRLVIGSSWPPDEALWLPILPDLLRRHPDLKIVLAPHEPLPDRLAELEASLGASGIETVRLSEFDGAGRCVLVDSVGVLADIYRAGTIAYVGGSFTTGVHNTMEPAIASLPVLFGPRIENAEEAGAMVAAGAGHIVRTADDALRMADALLSDETTLARAGEAARGLVLAQRGATEKSMALIEPYL